MTNLLDLLKDVDTGSAELQKEELSAKSTGSKYVNGAGVYSGTIERAYLTETKKGGVALNIHIGGESIADFVIYPVRKDKNGKKVSTQEYNGKTSSISDYLLLKQFVFCATGKGQALEDIKLVVEEIKFKKFDLLNALYITSVASSNQSLASSAFISSICLNLKVNQGVDGFVSIPCKDDDNNSNACNGEESKILSILLSPRLLFLVMSAFLGNI